MEAPYLTSSSITFTLFFLQAMCSGVKPFCEENKREMHVKDEEHKDFYWLKIMDVCVSYQRPGVGVGPLVQQQFGDSVVTTVSRHVQRCQVIQRDIINRSLVLQQVFNTLNVVALGGHVQRRQPVLKGDVKK